MPHLELWDAAALAMRIRGTNTTELCCNNARPSRECDAPAIVCKQTRLRN